MAENPYKIFLFLIESLRRQDKDTTFLERFLQGPQMVFDRFLDDVGRFRLITDYRQTPDDVVEYLLWQVGFTKELAYITNELSIDDQRKLIGAAVRMWKQRYLEMGIENMIRFLTGRTVIISTWFDLRWILGEDGFTIEPGRFTPYLMSPIDDPELDEYFTEIRIMDEGTANRFLLESLLRLNRPTSERFRVMYIDFIDDFTTGFSNIYQWENFGGSSEILDGIMVLNANSAVSADAENSYDWSNYVSTWIGRITAGGGMSLAFGFDGVSDAYLVELDVATQTATLRQYIGFTPGPVLASGPIDLVVGTWYGFKVENCWSGSSGVVNFYMDGNLIFSYNPGAEIIGSVGMATATHPGATAEFDIVELFQLPLDIKIIEPGG
jgi:phage tail-like protein